MLLASVFYCIRIDCLAKDYAKKFYKSTAWKKARRSYINKRKGIDGGLCEHCKMKKGFIVDHIVEITPKNINDVDVILNEGNFQYLCLECHNTKTFLKNKSVDDKLFFDEDGNIIQKFF